MKILLVNPPCRTALVLPLGLGYIASVLRNDGHTVSIMDLNMKNLPMDSVEKEIADSYWDVVGIGGLSTAYKFVKTFSAAAKKVSPRTKVIAGNMVSTASPHLLLDHADIDICVIDEGEDTVIELMRRLNDFPELEDVNGIAFKKDDKFIKTHPRKRIVDLDKIPYPAWDLFSMEDYIATTIHREYGRRSINVSAVRGCPFQCVYCSRPFGPIVHRRSTKSVIAELKELKRNYNIEFVCFSDDLFTLDKRWVMEFCDAMIGERIGIGWSSSARVNLVDWEFLKKLKKAGCEILGYGFESGSQKILDNMRKNVTVKQAEDAIRLTRKAGIIVEGSFMIGMAGETEETVNETVDFIKRTGLTLHRFFYTTPFPDTVLYKMAKDMGRMKYDEDEYMSLLGEMYSTFLVNLTDMPDEELKSLKERAEARIRKNFSIATRMNIALDEYKRTAANFKKHRNTEGAVLAMRWALDRAIKKIREV